MKKLNYAANREVAISTIEQIRGSSESPERKYIDLLKIAFYSAHQICKSAGDGSTLDIRDLLTFSLAKAAMHRTEFTSLNFDGWPETPGITFNVCTRQSARELAGAFVAAVAMELSKTKPHDFLYELEEQDSIEMATLTDWLVQAFQNLRVRLDLSNPALFDRDAESVALKLFAEAKLFFSPDASKEADVRNDGEWSKPMSKSRMMIALGIDSEHTFNAFAERIGIRRINRKTFQLRIDDLGSQEREKLEKA